MLLLASKNGEISVLENPDESDETQIILTLGDDEMCINGERGLQSVVVHPNFSQNHYVYVFYAKFREGCLEGQNVGPWNVVARFKMDPETLQLDTKEEVWNGAPTTKFMHNGGAMLFGNDGKLYVTTGDGGDSANSQPLNNVHGSVIRLNDDGTIPEDNPYTVQNGFNAYRCADSGGTVPGTAPADAVCSEVFANGLRNPFRLAVNPFVTDKVLFSISDVGGSHWEELNYGGSDFAMTNYGYPMRESVCEHGFDDACAPPGNDQVELLEPYQ
jgi:glucose/arabinose dehydrogenase